VIPGIVSEAFSNRFNVRTGDVIRLPAEPADLVVRIEGVFADYGNERGTLMIAGAAYVRHFGDTRAATLTVLVEPGVDPDVIAARIQSEFPAVRALSQKHLRTEVFRIFNQTFAITHALEIVGLAVALLGLGLSMASVLLDRKEELTTLRALGMSRRELSRAAAWEGAVVAAASCFGGVLLSGGLGWILIHVINRQSFGWTLTFSPPLLMLAGFTVLVIACGWFVSGLVGHRNASLAVEREG
jgi:putative ABC transport system permease protein